MMINFDAIGGDNISAKLLTICMAYAECLQHVCPSYEATL
jgi:hypothetical protein